MKAAVAICKMIHQQTIRQMHEFHETCHSITFIVLVNSHQTCKQTRDRVCLHLWCELNLAGSLGVFFFFMKENVTEWQVSWNSWVVLHFLDKWQQSCSSSCHQVLFEFSAERLIVVLSAALISEQNNLLSSVDQKSCVTRGKLSQKMTNLETMMVIYYPLRLALGKIYQCQFKSQNDSSALTFQFYNGQYI